MFYSIQGEGYYSGTPAIFIRFAGCNLKCPFCDTSHHFTHEVTEDDIVRFANSYPAVLVVFTGGEPSLQLTESLVDKLQKKGKYIAVETNGTNRLPNNVDWITLSPKSSYVGKVGTPVYRRVNELKVVFDAEHPIEDPEFDIVADYYYAQPCDTGDAEKNKRNIDYCVNFVKQNPRWKISLQTQKILNVR